MAAAAFILLAAAWLFGYYRSSADIESNFEKVLPQADQFVRSGSIWQAYQQQEGEERLIAYLGTGTAPSYGGPLQVIAAVDLEGKIIGSMVVDHRDTPSFFHNVAVSGFLSQLLGKSYQDPFQELRDVDAVTGATITSMAIARATQDVAVRIAGSELSKTIQTKKEPIQFGIPEGTLILLYLVGYIAHRPKFPRKKLVRWATMITSLIVLGFWFNRPLTVAHFTSLLAGYLPSWRENLYWFLLVGGILFVVTVDNKNPYCSWFCPFGAFQECLSVVGNTRWQPPRTWRFRLKWAARFLSFAALFFGLALRQPAATSYEIFGTLFGLTGSIYQWILLVIVILASLVIYRPWCTYLCPLDPIVAVVAASKRWMKELWQKKNVRE